MTSKYYFFIALFIFTISEISGQTRHELKADLLGLLSDNYTSHYELILSNNIGVEVGFGLNFSPTFLSNFNSTNFQKYEFSTTSSDLSIGGKYYFLFNKKYGNGLFAGPYVRLSYLLSRDEAYAEKWEEIHGPALLERQRTNGPKNLYYGISSGYKWVIKSNIIVEIAIALTVNHFLGKDVSGFNDFRRFRGDGYIKVGYRFKKKDL